MATSLLDIRFLIERNLRSQGVELTLDNDDVVNWCNYANSDVGMRINIPADTPATIIMTTTDLEYLLPADLKIINRIRRQSDIDQGIDAEFNISYRIYNGRIILPRVYWFVPDSLVIDYFKHMTYFTSIDDVIDIPDRFAPLYTFYGIAAAKAKDPLADPAYVGVKNQLVAYYSLGNEPISVDGRW